MKSAISKWYRNRKIQDKILVIFLPLVIIPLVTVGIVTNHILTTALINKNYEVTQSNAILITDRIDELVIQTAHAADMVTINLNRMFSEFDRDKVAEYERRYKIINELNNAKLIFSNIHSLQFVHRSGVTYSTMPDPQEPVEGPFLLSMLEEVSGSGGRDVWFLMTQWNDTDEKIMSLGKEVIHIMTGEVLGQLVIHLSESDLSAQFLDSPEYRQYFVISHEGQIISSTDDQQLLRKIPSTQLTDWLKTGKQIDKSDKWVNEEVLVVKAEFKKNDWSLIVVISLDDLHMNKQKMSASILLIIAICIVTVFWGGYKLSRVIARPIVRLTRVMGRIHEESYELAPSTYSIDEIGQLTAGYNKMIKKLDLLIVRIKREQRSKQEYEMALIQSQIKPHFLYNTLDVVYVLSDLGKSDLAKDAAKALADFYRYSLSSGKDIITLEEEVNMVQAYLFIQQIRYRDVFKYQINLDPQINKYSIMKLTLQPLVENAIYHGLRAKEDGGELKISGYLEKGTIYLEVLDTGVGMSKSKVEWLNQITENKESAFGLSSIKHRLNFYFGPKAGLYIESEEEVGTKAIIKIPGKDESDAASHDCRR
ncbi:sensor histidine kinase [Paenibacillus chungangensis]|uniref:Sensor histidine kinase n=1 Tax=Paenibacillus chungangensis TaxID=696535 RepID=A0ABW3HL71_9BACL